MSGKPGLSGGDDLTANRRRKTQMHALINNTRGIIGVYQSADDAAKASRANPPRDFESNSIITTDSPLWIVMMEDTMTPKEQSLSTESCSHYWMDDDSGRVLESDDRPGDTWSRIDYTLYHKITHRF